MRTWLCKSSSLTQWRSFSFVVCQSCASSWWNWKTSEWSFTRASACSRPLWRSSSHFSSWSFSSNQSASSALTDSYALMTKQWSPLQQVIRCTTCWILTTLTLGCSHFSPSLWVTTGARLPICTVPCQAATCLDYTSPYSTSWWSWWSSTSSSHSSLRSTRPRLRKPINHQKD